MTVTACPGCGGPVLAHCLDSRMCDLFDCADTQRCRGFGTRDGARFARRPSTLPPIQRPPGAP